MSHKRLRSSTPVTTPAASVVGSSCTDTPRSAAGGRPQETWIVAEIPHKRGTHRVLYPSSIFGPLTHMGQDGAFGTVFSSVRLRDNQPVVIKQQPLETSTDCEASMRELCVLTHFCNPRLRHPNIIQVLKVWEAEECLYFVLPKLDCSLHTFVNEGSLNPVQRMTIFSHVLSGLRHLHHYGVIHRDLKPENIVLTRDLSSVQLIDFGASRVWIEGTQYTQGKFVSTFPYRAPETEDGSYSPAADIWALGCILARLIAGRTLFNGKETTLARDRQLVMERIKPLQSIATPYEYQLLQAMLKLDPTERISTSDLYDWHFEHVKDEPYSVPRISHRAAPKTLTCVNLDYDYEHIPSMRRNITVLVSRCCTALKN
eukprot:PhF_6_TR34708/c1_g1_i1/m.50506